MKTWRGVINMVDADLLDWQLEARACGLLTPGPLTRQTCDTFDSIDGTLGVFRTFGRLSFDKTDRRWEVRPCADATPAEMGNLIRRGCKMVWDRGTTPGQSLRSKAWKHHTGSVDGHRYAYTFLAREVDSQELLELMMTEAIDDIFELPVLEIETTGPIGNEVSA